MMLVVRRGLGTALGVARDKAQMQHEDGEWQADKTEDLHTWMLIDRREKGRRIRAGARGCARRRGRDARPGVGRPDPEKGTRSHNQTVSSAGERKLGVWTRLSA